MYSALAGFMEPGESMEDTVKREVHEEVGIELNEIRYFASQPWPFPRSVMLGCYAAAASHEIKVGEELHDARWFGRQEVLQMLDRSRGKISRQGMSNGQLWTPPPRSLAHEMLNNWASNS
eukprot:TRINITY_DN8105_c0_g1::TRINITY_DN8105_c0_g1_i1::g.20249::m.20249 TRINITY_DN8105_c0_g1::TRINITY_DN8105_c0_g1_i1::g.20249  ORF type:complete len:120 (+),score=20.58,sp/Q9BQG2/NUD12_HUMAN/44.83/3e-31,NUDIX/PF00293.23/9.5e-11,7TM_GPCR_Str/PF10326.4/0.26 TRINITY_DN8105_c0_g1_i1:737-1096(+)